MQGAVEMVGGERESMSACETKRGAEGEEVEVHVCVCGRARARVCMCVCLA